MRHFLYRLTYIIFLSSLISTTVTAGTDHAQSSVPGAVSGYNDRVNHQHNWGLFGIIGVIALAGLTKRNVMQKNEINTGH